MRKIRKGGGRREKKDIEVQGRKIDDKEIIRIEL